MEPLPGEFVGDDAPLEERGRHLSDMERYETDEHLVQNVLVRAFGAFDTFDGRYPRAWLHACHCTTPYHTVRTHRPDLLDDEKATALPAACTDGGIDGTADADLVAAHLGMCAERGIEAGIIEKVIERIRDQRPDLDPQPLQRLAGAIDELERHDST